MSNTFDKVLILKNISLFEGASEMALSDLISVSEEKTYKAGEELLKKDVENSHLYIVLSGNIYCTDKDGTVTELGARQFFGETTVFSPAVIPFSVKASERTSVLRISSNRLYHMISLHPSIARGFIGELSKRLQRGYIRNI